MTHRQRLHTLHGGSTHTNGFARIQRHNSINRTSDITVRPIGGQRSLQDRRSANARYQRSHTMTRYRHDAHFGGETTSSEYLQGEEPYMRNERLRDGVSSRVKEPENSIRASQQHTQRATVQSSTQSRFAPNIKPRFTEPSPRKFDPFG